MTKLPATVVSNTIEEPLDWPGRDPRGATLSTSSRLKEKSAVPLRSHGSLSLNWALMAAGLVDRVQVTLFPVIWDGAVSPIFGGAGDYDLELLESLILDGRTHELIYRPSAHP